MRNELKKNLTYKKIVLILSALCISSGILSVLLTELAAPIAAATLAALLLFESGGAKYCSYLISAALVAINLVSVFFLGATFSLWSVIAVSLAHVIYLTYVKGSEKSEAVFIATTLTSLILALGLVIMPMIIQGQASFEVVKDFYTGILDAIRADFSAAVNAALTELEGNGANPVIDFETLMALFDSRVSMVISYLIIFAFVISGVAFKIFSFIATKCSEDTSAILTWRFRTSSVFAYFYFIITIASIFMVDTGSVFAISVLNLGNIFTFVYFYVGFTVALAYLSRNRRPVSAALLLIVVVILFATYALQILALIGAFHTIRSTQLEPQK